MMMLMLEVDQASWGGVLCVYAADGVPVLPSTPPIMIADLESKFVRGSVSVGE